MKTTVLMTVAALVGTCLIAGAEAGPKGPKGPKGKRTPPPEVLEKFDKNKDGKLTGDERTAAREEMKKRRAEMLEKFDEDKDGKLSQKERKAARDAGYMKGKGKRGEKDGEGKKKGKKKGGKKGGKKAAAADE